MNGRFTANTITSDVLDALYTRAERAERRLRLAHQARRAKERQLDEIRRAMCDAEIIEDDDPYGHADLAMVIRQITAGPAAAEATYPREHCGHIKPEGITPDRSECVLRPNHSGSHADAHGARWWLTPTKEQP